MTVGEKLFRELLPLEFSNEKANELFEAEEPISVYQAVRGQTLFFQVVNGRLYVSNDGEHYKLTGTDLFDNAFNGVVKEMELAGRLGYYPNTIFQAYWAPEERWIYFHHVAKILNFPDREEYITMVAPAAYNLIEHSLCLDSLPLLASIDWHPTHTERELQSIVQDGIRRYGEGSPLRNSMPSKVPGLIIVSELAGPREKTLLLLPKETKVLSYASYRHDEKDKVE